MLTDLANGDLDCVVCWHPDRLHRSPRELEDFIDLVEKTGAAVATVTSGDYDLATGDGRFVAPLIESGRDTWAPSGIAILGDHLYVTALRGKRLLRFRLSGDGVVADGDWLKGTHGRLRDVVVGPDGALYVATSNHDGRGSPASEDDRILRVWP